MSGTHTNHHQTDTRYWARMKNRPRIHADLLQLLSLLGGGQPLDSLFRCMDSKRSSLGKLAFELDMYTITHPKDKSLGALRWSVLGSLARVPSSAY